MKTKKLIIALITLFLVSSCAISEVYPEPDENPVNLSCEKQTKTIHVKDISGICPEDWKAQGLDENGDEYYGEDDIYIRTPTTEAGYTITVKYKDWFKAYYKSKKGTHDNDVEISVEENTSSENRLYILVLHRRDKDTNLVINQAGCPE